MSCCKKLVLLYSYVYLYPYETCFINYICYHKSMKADFFMGIPYPYLQDQNCFIISGNVPDPKSFYVKTLKYYSRLGKLY